MDAYAGDDYYCDVAIPRRTRLEVVHEDDELLAYHHTRPFWPVHLVVVPTRHVASMLALTRADARLAERLLTVVQDVAAVVEREHGAASIVTNLGAYQDSKHLHVHVRFGDPLPRSATKLVRDRVPERIRAAGGSVATERLGDAAYGDALREKLVEEAREVAAADGREQLVEELSDVVEVLRALEVHEGIAAETILERADAKRGSHGGFDERLRTRDYVAPPSSVSGADARSRRRAAAASRRQRSEQ